MPTLSILEAMDHPDIWRPWFRDAATWAPWRAFLAAMFGLPMSEADLDLFRECTGREAPPSGGSTEAWLVVGRRGGKSMILAVIACYLACFRDYRAYLSPGEVGTIKVIATDRKQAKVIHRYCRALLTKVPAFAQLIDRDTGDALELVNSVTIEIATASFRSVRGFTVIAALCDEIAYWRSEETSANPDAEIIAALRPAMATIPGAFLLAASSPYARRGELYQAYRRYYARDDAEALVWQAPTRTMNPTVRQSFIDEQTDKDPSKAAAEYGAQFRVDIEGFVSREVVDAAVVLGRHELPPDPHVRYFGFVDSSGSGQDSMTMAISHRDKDGTAILDLLRERRPPFSPASVTTEFCGNLKAYGIKSVRGDAYGLEWVAERFRKNGIAYVKSELPKSGIYQEMLAPLNSGRVELLDDPRLIQQLCGLERRTARGTGKDSIDHAPGAHDDVANAAAGAIWLASSQARTAIVISPEAMAAARRPSPTFQRRLLDPGTPTRTRMKFGSVR
jgi:hypothetical protein